MNSNQKIAVIDLLRGISCLGVLLYHVRVDLWVGWWRITNHPKEFSFFDKAMAWLSIPTPFLGYAILLFFLISGFCIHYPNTQPNYRPSWITYFKRRFWRIYPTYFVAIIFTSSASFYCLLKWGDVDWSPDRIFRVLTLTQNYPPHYGQFLTNPSLWTIPLEVEFYILYPIAYYFITKFKFYIVILLSIAVSTISIFLGKQDIFLWVTYTSLFFWPSWLLGAWIASLYRQNKLSNLNHNLLISLSIAMLICALTAQITKGVSWIQYATWTIFYFLIFIICLFNEEFLSNFKFTFAFKAIAWIGKISFSLYLIHFPLFKIFGYFHVDYFGEKPTNFLIPLFYLFPVIFISWGFYKCIEEPIHKYSKKTKVME
jgi:peptidoglycan/LPS O-acetylase OafA/YrhL